MTLILTSEEWHDWATSIVTKQFIKEIQKIRLEELEDDISPDDNFSLCKQHFLRLGRKRGYENIIAEIKSKAQIKKEET